MSYLTLADGITPATPASAKTRLYTQAGRVASVDSSGANRFKGGSAPWNLLRNSGFWFAQRQAPAAGTAYTPAANSRIVFADGWSFASTLTLDYSRWDTSGNNYSGVTEGMPSRFLGSLIKPNGVSSGSGLVMQVIDGVETDTVRGRLVRFSIKLMLPGDSADGVSSRPYAYRIGLLAWSGTVDAMGATVLSSADVKNDPNLSANWSFVSPARATGLNCVASNNGYTCLATQTGQNFSGTFLVPTSVTNIAVAVWSLVPLQSALDGFWMGDAMLTDGEEVYEYTHLGLANEYLRVARFYQKSFAIDHSPIQAAGANTGELHFPSNVAGATAFAGIPVQFQVRMYKAPTTLTLYNPAAATAQIRNVTLGTDCTVSTITASDASGAWINATAPTSTAAGNNMAVHWTADGEL